MSLQCSYKSIFTSWSPWNVTVAMVYGVSQPNQSTWCVFTMYRMRACLSLCCSQCVLITIWSSLQTVWNHPSSYTAQMPRRGNFLKRCQHTRWYNKMNARLDKKWERLWQEDFAPLFSSDQDPPDVQHCVQPQAHPCQHIKVISSLDAFKFQTSYSMMI